MDPFFILIIFISPRVDTKDPWAIVDALIELRLFCAILTELFKKIDQIILNSFENLAG